MTTEELREWYINDIESKQIVIDDLKAQLSAKEQECEKYKKLYDAYASGPVINPLYADNGELCGYSLISRDTGETLCSEEDKERFDALDQMVLDATRKEMRLETELASLRAENERLKEEILSERAFTWELTSLRDENDRLKKIVLSDKETHDRAEYSLRKRCEDLEAEIESMKKNRRCSIG